MTALGQVWSEVENSLDGLPQTRQEAKECGARYYATGQPCKNGHVARRQTSNGNCLLCNRRYTLSHYRKNSDSWKNRIREYQARNPGLVKSWSLVAYERNKAAYIVRAVNRGLAQRQRMPPWLTASQRGEITEVYRKRDALQKATGENYHVDHIVPLQGERVSGLHVPWNLQVLPAKENLAKSNHFE